MNIILIGGVLMAFLLYLGWESFQLKKKRRLIPIRICVTGTRGKSTVVRLIAASLRAADYRVVAKTTGSKPMVILADGAEKEILRRGLPSILEGIRLINLAKREQARILVTEMMSINPESMAAESLRIFSPHIMVITNVRPDHQEQWGDSRAGIADCFAAAIPAGCTLFVPAEEMYPVFQDLSASGRVDLNPVPEDIQPDSRNELDHEFSQNLRLTLAVSQHLGIDRDSALSGLQNVNPDFGSLQVWHTHPEAGSGGCYLVSGFAANDPESTCMVFEKMSRLLPLPGKKLIGLLNLRWDRADRTRQWLDALDCGRVPEFDVLALVGGHARAVSRRLAGNKLLKKVIVLPNTSAESILQSLCSLTSDQAVIFGMGNMEGAGAELVSLWQEKGNPYVL